ncbi:MAG: DUF2508 family protein [Deltaproteobacteria bacterium]
MERNTPGPPDPEGEWLGETEAFWARTRRAIKEYFQPARKEEMISDEEMLQQAHRELLEAQNRFSIIEEPELVDCAIYALKSAEIKYDYILRRIKQKRSIEIR